VYRIQNRLSQIGLDLIKGIFYVFRDFIKAVFIIIGLALMPDFYQSCSRETPQLKDQGLEGGCISITDVSRVHELIHGPVLMLTLISMMTK
jgi:hypothetical protein